MFRVIERKGRFPQRGLPVPVLIKDGWDDFGFKTQYGLAYVNESSEQTHIGSVKILKKGQEETIESLLLEDIEDLDENYCSIGQSLDYYEHLAELGPKVRDEILSGLRDVVLYPEIAAEFENEKGWGTSLFRDIPDREQFILLARSLLSGDYTTLPADDLSFTFKTSAVEEELIFDFSAPKLRVRRSLFSEFTSAIPSRVCVLIGRNGSGKSTLLARLARVAHGSTGSRAHAPLIHLGKISPAGIGFPRVLTISYSAFDSFRLPGVTREEQEQIVRDIERGEGRFVFCGLRDIAEELKQELAQVSPVYQEIDERNVVAVDQDRLRQNLLKPVEKLAEEFERTLDRIAKKGRKEVFDHVLEKLFSDPSFNDQRGLGLQQLKDGNPRQTFLTWSTGHKIVMQIVSSIAAYAEPKSLVLIDEPETHLHPPLLAALMHAIRIILRSTKSFAIIATHSPVVLQETLAKHVLVITREGQIASIRSPEIETFGENIGMVTSEVFGLNSEVTDFHTTLDRLVEDCQSTEEIESLFSNGGMSFQARAYVLSKISSKS